jgi:hypothetical protein
MAFKNVGSIVFLAPGATATWNYSYGMDMGPQFACADIKFMGRGSTTRRPARYSVPTINANSCKEVGTPPIT